MGAPPLSIVVTNTPYLSQGHLLLQVDAFNRQSARAFQVFYLNQDPDPEPLRQALVAAAYPFRVVPLPFPWLADTCCWDMVSVMGRLLEQPVHGDYLTYLHKECMPAPDFVESLLEGIAASEAVHGPEAVYRLNQLRCGQIIESVGALWPLELAAAEPISWIARRPYRPEYVFAERAWEEDAFALPIAWARRTGLFGKVRIPLFFQDLFDIFYQLPNLPAFARLKWIHLGQPILWHLNHARAFYEYRRPFLQAVAQHPELFGHLALYELAGDGFDYVEDFAQGERLIPERLHRFVRYMRYSDKGTVTLWRQLLAMGSLPLSSEGLQ